MGTDYVDVFNLHAVDPFMYDYARDTLAPALVEQQAKGKIRHIGLTEIPILDHTNETLRRAVNDPVWEVFMVGFHRCIRARGPTCFRRRAKRASARC